MALINCPECNKEFSDKAPACPHCGCPVESHGTPTASIPPRQAAASATTIHKNPTNWSPSPRLAWLALTLLFASLVGYFVYCKTIKLHPVITLCESVIIDRLKSPSSYKPLKREMVVIDRKYYSGLGLGAPAWVSIEYTTANLYNAMIKGNCQCFMGLLEYKGQLLRGHNVSTLGKSPFNALNIVKIVMEDKEIKVPISFMLKDTKANIFTPPAPGFITNWIGLRGTDYVLSEQLDKEEIENNREKLEQQEKTRVINF